ncbi:MAG: hypothetical protein JO030_09005 [Candidatus Eremiobacteraeota bacterium]|nr:hypothetical protein [Candidatus Eremiobacteraeota bacterium]
MAEQISVIGIYARANTPEMQWIEAHPSVDFPAGAPRRHELDPRGKAGAAEWR